MQLTERAQGAVHAALRPGDLAIDATAGNGHDTLFLARAVGREGRVWAFDLQDSAMAATRRRLDAEGIGTVRLVAGDHVRLLAELSREAKDRAGAIMFNLGYLPGGDKSVTTSAASTRAALPLALKLLRPGGVMTILAYPGHAAGAEESAVVDEFRDGLSTSLYRAELVAGPPGRTPSPRLTIIQRSLSQE